MSGTDAVAEKTSRRHRHSVLRKCTMHKALALAVVIAGIFIGINIFAPVVLSADRNYATYFYLALLGITGFFTIRLISQLVYQVVADDSAQHARAAKSLIVTAGYLIMVALAISIIARSPTVTVVIGTVTGIILGISMQSLIGNAMAGMVLAITRPFRIGDVITVFSNTGSVYDIGLLYTSIITADGKTVLAPNTSLLTTAIVKEKKSARTSEVA